MQVNSQKYAVVDLEATGAHAMAEIIQVGIVIIENDQIVKTYQTDVNPHEALTEHIIHLTGITDEQLAKARRVGRPNSDHPKKLIAVRLSPKLLADLRKKAARKRKPYQTFMHELLEKAVKAA